MLFNSQIESQYQNNLNNFSFYNIEDAMRIIIIYSILLCLTNQVSGSELMAYAEKKSLHSKTDGTIREYYVHLPESYQSNSLRKYPVLYVLHGQSDTLGAVASIKTISNDIPELIVIGVQNRRDGELAPVRLKSGELNSKGKSFRRFLIHELVPHVKQKYRIADFSILSGHSGSGRFVLNSFLDDPGAFSAYFAFSPSIDDNLINDRIKREQPKLAANNTRLYITLANEGEHMEKPFRELVSIFSQSAGGNTLFRHKEYPEQSHASTYLVSQLFSLRALFEGWRPSWDVRKLGVSGVKRHYKQLSIKFRFEVEIPASEWLQLSFIFSRFESEEGNKKAEEVVDFALENYPSVEDEFFNIVQQLAHYGFVQPSKNLHQLLCKKLTEHKKCK